MMRSKTSALALALVTCFSASTTRLPAKDASAALDLARQLNEAFIEVAEKVSPSVVLITVTEKQKPNDVSAYLEALPDELRRWYDEQRSQRSPHNKRAPKRQEELIGKGSGIIITEDGYILTNNHVVEGAEKISVRLKDGRRFDAVVKGRDPESDVAVIKIEAKGLTKAALGDSEKTRVGEFAIAIGAPFEFDYSVTVGHVSAKGRAMDKGYADQDFLQTDASINPGNSGGPLVNLYGEVIGINSMIYGMHTGIGFAIPINLAKRVEEHLIHDGKFTRSRIGVGIRSLREYQDLTEFDKSLTPDVEDGVVITAIMPDGPASKSDLKAGDVVIAVNGKTVKTERELKDEVSTSKVGSTLTLTAVRGTKHLTLKVTTDAVPSAEMAENSADKKGDVDAATYGLAVQPLTEDLAASYNLKPGSGVVVSEVEQSSPAAIQGIKAGDVITEVNRKPVSTPRQFREAIKNSDPKRGVMLNLIGEEGSKFLILKEGAE